MSSETLNDILFEVTGVGKSSVINLTARSPMAQTSTVHDDFPGLPVQTVVRKLNEAGGINLILRSARQDHSYHSAQLPALLRHSLQQLRLLSLIWRGSIGWKIGGNENAILKRGLQSAGHACVSGIERDAHKYSESIDALLHLLSQHDNRGRFSMPPKPWFR
ncbi:hypothetical protein J3A83DRAFT_4189935 [Scleroderma citrinum]